MPILPEVMNKVLFPMQKGKHFLLKTLLKMEEQYACFSHQIWQILLIEALKMQSNHHKFKVKPLNILTELMLKQDLYKIRDYLIKQ